MFDAFSNVSKGNFGINGEDWMRERRFSAIVYGAVVLVRLAAVVSVVVSCGRRQPARMPPAPTTSVLRDTVRVRGVERKVSPDVQSVTTDASILVPSLWLDVRHGKATGPQIPSLQV